MEDRNKPAVLKAIGGRLIEARRAALAGQSSGPHRMEHVAEVNGVVYINDSKATFLDATLDSLGQLEGQVVWIVGDLTMEMDEGLVGELLLEKVAAVVLFGRKPAANEEPPSIPVEHFYATEDLRTAVFLANELAVEGQSVLFSPACPSGNGFANYEERGAEFKRAVRDL
ncbi:MAG: cyanophycin synthetase [Flavobacteriales bacterium]